MASGRCGQPLTMTTQLTQATTVIAIEDVSQWCGQDILDTNGDKLGKLDHVLWDTEIDAPAFAAVKSGTFGKHLTLVSLSGATAGASISVSHRT